MTWSSNSSKGPIASAFWCCHPLYWIILFWGRPEFLKTMFEHSVWRKVFHQQWPCKSAPQRINMSKHWKRAPDQQFTFPMSSFWMPSPHHPCVASSNKLSGSHGASKRHDMDFWSCGILHPFPCPQWIWPVAYGWPMAGLWLFDVSGEMSWEFQPRMGI